MSVKKTNYELLKELDNKMLYLEKLLKEVLEYDLSNEIRKQTCDSMAVFLRTLVIDRGKQTSLITSSKTEGLFYFKSKGGVLWGKNNLAPESLLTGYRISNNELNFYPNLDSDDINLFIGFNEWLNEIILDDKTENDNLVSRYEIITAIADKEGAHVDLSHDKKLYKISHINKMNIVYEINGNKMKAKNNIYYESIIVIAKELLESYDLYKKIKDMTKTIIQRPELFICQKQNLSAKLMGYRYNRWFSGNEKDGQGALNTIVFASDDIVTKVAIGKLKIHKFTQNKKDIFINYIDFNKYQENGTIISSKNPPCLVAVEKVKKQYVLLSGSSVAETTILPLKCFKYPNQSLMIKENIKFSKDELFENIGIDIIDIKL